MPAMIIRFSDELHRELEFISSIDNIPMSDLIRSAVSDYIRDYKLSPDFQGRLREHIQIMGNMKSI